jgi:hypothetical protein
MRLRPVAIAFMTLLLAGVPLVTQAGPVALTPDAGVFQQTQNNPCVIGNPSCNNPAGFDFALLPVNPTSPQITISPTYSVGQIRTLLQGGNTFFVGVDISQAQGQPAYTLNSFTVSVAGTDAFQFTGPQDFTSSGNGFSDFVLETIDLTTFAGNAPVIFTANFSNDNRAREQFFVVSSAEPPATVPEPATLLLVGSTLAATGLLCRRATRDR